MLSEQCRPDGVRQLKDPRWPVQQRMEYKVLWLTYQGKARYTMMTSSNGNIFRVTGHLCGEFTGHRWIPSQRPVTRSFDVFFDLRPNKRLSKHSRGRWFESPSRSLWCHCNAQPVVVQVYTKQIPAIRDQTVPRWRCRSIVVGLFCHWWLQDMVTSSNWNIFRVTCPMCGEFTGHLWIPSTKASDAELWCFLWSAPEPIIEQRLETSVIWDAIALIMT